MNRTIELCLDTFGDITDGPDGKPLHAAQVIRNLVEEAVLADELGVENRLRTIAVMPDKTNNRVAPHTNTNTHHGGSSAAAPS